MIPKNKVWKITYYTGRADFSPKDHRDIIAPTRRLALLNFRHEVGFFAVVSCGVRRARKIVGGPFVGGPIRLGERTDDRFDDRTLGKDRPAFGRQYRLTGGVGVSCIANGNTWAESEVSK